MQINYIMLISNEIKNVYRATQNINTAKIKILNINFYELKSFFSSLFEFEMESIICEMNVVET